jgi:riboflavin biosynthesis pyrimidine reductase
MELESLRDALEFPTREDRPYTIANFVSTFDGRAALKGRSAPLSSPGDRVLFHTLRERVDAIIAGTRTLRTERYGRMIKDAEARDRRVARGLEPEPLACVVTRSGDVPTEIPLFTTEDEPRPRIALFTTPEADIPADCDVVRIDPAELTLLTVLRRLRADYGVTSLLCEGGPTLFASFLHEQLVDELFLTLSPQLAGGGAEPTVAVGIELENPAQLRLRWALARDESLFLRAVVSSEGA